MPSRTERGECSALHDGGPVGSEAEGVENALDNSDINDYPVKKIQVFSPYSSVEICVFGGFALISQFVLVLTLHKV